MRALMMSLLLASAAMAGYAGPQSLPEFARQERARRKANPVESVKVYTNENIPKGPGPDSRTSVPVPAPPSSRVEPAPPAEAPDEGPPPAESAPISPESAPAPGDSAPPEPRTEEEWRARFAQARQELERAENSVALLELERAELNQQLLTRDDLYNRENQLRPQIQEKEAELSAGRARVDAATRALSDLFEALRRSGAPAGWSRP